MFWRSTVTPIVATIEELRLAVASARAAGQRIGLVPTMGALHAGHISLIRAARQEVGFVVLSLFVNPTQFGPQEDLARYPRPFEQDWAICTRERVDLIFAPPVEAIYPQGYRTYVEVHELQDVLEGASRPGHFRGVCTVVLKLFNLVSPDVAYFGQKDAQQVIVLRRMLEDLNVSLALRVCPTVRERDGLALSSRNQYLTPEERARATALIGALHQGRDLILAGERDGSVIRSAMEALIAATPGATLDHAVVVDARSLAPLSRLEGTVLLAVAGRIGSTRLIDNLLLQVSAKEARVLPTIS
jgi:pantoate--beta-alanine ligase